MRVKTDDRRQVIIEAATKVFRKEGYARSSMDGIARQAAAPRQRSTDISSPRMSYSQLP